MIRLAPILLFAIVTSLSSCSESSLTDLEDSDLGRVSNYLPVKQNNWWAYTIDSGTTYLRKTIGDTARRQDGTLVHYFTDDYSTPGEISFGFWGWYSMTDSCLINYESLLDSIFHDGQWFPIGGRMVPLLRSPLVKGHTWSYTHLGRTETFTIESVGARMLNGQFHPSVVTVLHWDNLGVDTTLYSWGLGVYSVHDWRGTKQELDSSYVQ